MKISVRQICFIMFAYTAANKLLSYPPALSSVAGRDLLFSSALNFILSGVIIWSLAYMCSRTDKTFFGMLYSTFGRVGSIIIGGLFAAFFMFAAYFPLAEQERYVHSIFYETIPSYLTFLPFFVFSVYAACKGFTNIGRSADICLPIFLMAIEFLLIMSFGQIDTENFLPILKTPVQSVFGGVLNNIFRFPEPAYMLFFVGRFKYKKGDAARITVAYAAGALVVLTFLFAFYGVYGNLAPDIPFGTSKIALFFPAINVIGRVDLIALYMLELVQIFALVLNIQLAVYCIKTCIYPDDGVYEGRDALPIISFAVNAALIVPLILCDSFFVSVMHFYAEWGWIIFALFAILAPLAAWALKRRERRA